MPIFQLVAIFIIAFQVPYLATFLVFFYTGLSLFFIIVLLLMLIYDPQYLRETCHEAAIESRTRSTFTIWSSIITSGILVGTLLTFMPFAGIIFSIAMLIALYIHTYA